MSRNLIFGLVLQSLLFSFVFASDNLKAQKLKEVVLNINAGDISLKESFGIIENQTDFKFSYSHGSIPLKTKINIDSKNENLEQILLKIARDAKVEFKRINEQIVVRRHKRKFLNKEELISSFQEIIISGKIIDSSNGEVIPGASILVKGESTGTISDMNGDFKLAVTENAVILVTFIGYKSQEIAIGEQTTFSIELTPDLKELQEVLIVGYGKSTKKEVTGAVEDVKSVKEISNRPINNVGQVLQGNVAGVTVINDGGDPTANPLIWIRGVGTLSSEGPLYVVDGVIGGAVPNPDNIASMTVLKDASSAAIYGVRAASGVILIETKKGQEGKMNVSFNSYMGFQKVGNTLEPLNAQEYADIMNTAFDNAGLADDNPSREYIDPNKNAYGLVTRTNWMDEIFQKGKMQNYDLALSGGNKKSTFYTALGYRKIEGTLLNTESERISLRLNSTYNLRENLQVGENFSLAFTNGNYGVNTTSGYTGAIITALYYPPSALVWEDEAAGLYGGVTPRDNLTYAGSYGDLINPVAYLHRLDNRKPSTTLSGNFFIDYEIIEGLHYKLNAGLTRINSTSKNFTSKILEPGKIFNFNELYQSNNISNSLLLENTLSYQKFIGNDHLFNVLAGYTVQKNESEFFSMSARGFESEDESLRYFPNATGPFNTPNGGKGENRLVSVLARLNYSYKDKYLVSAIVRRDGTSKLNQDNRYGTFPSVSAGWRISKEAFMEDISFINDLKIRGSWGKIGNLGPLGNYATSISLSRTRALLGDPASIDNYFGYAINGLVNPDLQWETTVQTDFGIDAQLFGNKVAVTADYFIKETEDMILAIPLTGTAGVSNSPYENVGKVENKGWELTLAYRELSKPFKYEFSGNLSSLKNKVITLGENYEGGIPHGNNVRGILRPLRSEVGQPLYSFYLYENAGIFQSETEVAAHKSNDGKLIQPLAQPGDLKFVDQNGDGVLDEKDKVFKGNAFPNLSYGFNAMLGYKNFDFTVFFQGVDNIKVFNGLKFSTLKPTQGYNMLADVKNAWSSENTGSDIPILSVKDDNNNFGTESDWYLEDASYLRLKNLTIGYSLPSALTNKINAEKLRFYFTGTNLLTFTNYSGMDPEVIADRGIDMGRYPQAKSYILGLNLTF
ncbi:MAG: TonB-dependent receptor [Flammeovirgaceae bacterium]|nr:TonB-dependent receptor [Flammeovirgaceae bacterium]